MTEIVIDHARERDLRSKAFRDVFTYTTVPVVDSKGRILLYDMFVEGVFIGSASTVSQAAHRIEMHKGRAALAKSTADDRGGARAADQLDPAPPDAAA